MIVSANNCDDMGSAELKSKKLVSIPTKKSAYINPIVLVQKADKVPSLLEKKFISKFIG